MKIPAILIIDDESELRSLIARLLSINGYKIYQSGNIKDGLLILDSNEIDIVILDVNLPDGKGILYIPEMKSRFPNTEIIVLTAYGSIEDGVSAIKQGAFDYITKGDEDNKIIPLVKKILNKYSYLNNSDFSSFDNIIGQSPQIKEAKNIALQVAAADIPILLQGETGTGKEIFAQAIHKYSQRKDKIFLALNCSSFSKELIESEIFGYKAGAFTGAVRDKKGLFEEADGGTLFLDEVGEIDIAIQAKLLRVLETGSFIKPGETKSTNVNVRIIAATNKNLVQAIEEGAFRSDLYYRLNVVTILLPPLRDRKGDIPVFIDYFVNMFTTKFSKKIESIEPSFYDILGKYTFPGNIRELRNLLERIVLLSNSLTLNEKNIPKDFYNALDINDQSISSNNSLDDYEKKHIIETLIANNNNKIVTAKILGIGLTTLYRKLQKYGIDI